MLKHLHIRNYALIAELDIDFESGFSVMTGETGAGKSIILGALSLVMGGKADAKSITEGEERCVIEATFVDEAPRALDEAAKQLDELIIRRELSVNGRSRSFVNDEVVSQAELKRLAAQLIDIHSQHESLLLGEDDFQLGIVDALADNEKEREAYTAAYTAYQEAAAKLREVEALARKTKADADYVQFQFNQLEEARLVAGEETELEEEQYRLSHAEDIRAALDGASEALENDNQGILTLLKGIRIEEASSELSERIRSAEIELRDIAREVSRLADRTEADPERLQEIEERLDLLNTLMRKHSVKSVEELITLRDELEQQCQRIDGFDEEIAELKKKMQSAECKVQSEAEKLRKTREKVLPKMEKSLIKDLSLLGVAHPQVKVELTALPDFRENGMDDVQILFAANLNQTVRRVSEVASGGEISRLMLCIKSLIASTNGLPTIIFDEIDTGVSGEVATQMGHIMREMARCRQVLAITHLPQIAALGEHHYEVYKADTKSRTETNIRALQEAERVEAIATMLSGKNPTEAARENAKQLLGCARLKV